MYHSRISIVCHLTMFWLVMSSSRAVINECHHVHIPTTALYLDAQIRGKPRTCFGFLRLSSRRYSKIKMK